MTWYRKPKPVDPPSAPGPCILCGAPGAVGLGSTIAPEDASAQPASRWLCRACADQRRGEPPLN
jgi:hypothetical protein